jgi:hypothetical protein
MDRNPLARIGVAAVTHNNTARFIRNSSTELEPG